MTESVKNLPLQWQINSPKVMDLYIYKVSIWIYYGNVYKPNCHIAMLGKNLFADHIKDAFMEK